MEDLWRHENEALLARIHKNLGTTENGNIGLFQSVPPIWRCRCCYRTKEEFARKTEKGKLLCALHWHHDHFVDRLSAAAKERICGSHPMVWDAARDGLGRFSRVLICNDCNVTEVGAKKGANLHEPFSFSPSEIARFIRVGKNRNHGIDFIAVKSLWAGVSVELAELSAVFAEIEDLVHGRLHGREVGSLFGITQAL